MLNQDNLGLTSSSGGNRIERMFSGIAPWYDFLNRLLSLRRDVFWRRRFIEGLSLPSPATVLDLAAGTLDVSLELLRQHPDVRVIAADFSLPMLLLGQQKLAGGGGGVPIFPVAADAYALPFPEAAFDAVTMAFGIRNLPERASALAAILRVLKPGGTLAVLEFVPPASGTLQALYKIYLNGVLPLIGRVFSQHDFAYRYLAESIAAFPPAGVFVRELQTAGFREVRHQLLTFGVVGLFYGCKPEEAGNQVPRS